MYRQDPFSEPKQRKAKVKEKKKQIQRGVRFGSSLLREQHEVAMPTFGSPVKPSLQGGNLGPRPGGRAQPACPCTQHVRTTPAMENGILSFINLLFKLLLSAKEAKAQSALMGQRDRRGIAAESGTSCGFFSW